MKKLFVPVPLFLLSVSALTGGELLFSPGKVSDFAWDHTPDKVSVAEENGTEVFTVHGYRQLFSKKKIVIEPDAVYRLSGEFRAKPGSAPGTVFYFGFAQTTRPAKGRRAGNLINSPPVNVIGGTHTVLAAPCEKKDTVIRIVSAENWKEHGIAVFGAKEDLSDLPNYQFTRGSVRSIEKKASHYDVALSKPVGFAFPAGTPLREHMHGGNYHYAGAVNEKVPAEWTKFEGTVSGIAKSGLPRDKWWPGAHEVSVMILGNYTTKKGKDRPADAELQFRNLKFEKITEKGE